MYKYEDLIEMVINELKRGEYDSKTDIEGDVFVYLYDEEVPKSDMEMLRDHIIDCVWDLN